jgi:hypothetical protein
MRISGYQTLELSAMALNAFCVCCVMGKWVPSSALKRRGWRCNGRDWHTLLEFCSIVGALLIDAEAVYDPRLTNDRLLLGMKGTISEMEVASFRERAQAALLQKAQRGALIRRAAIGYVKGPDDRIEKDPDARVRSTLDLIFRKFAELGSVRQVYFWLDQQHIQLPVVRGSEEVREIVWLPAR